MSDIAQRLLTQARVDGSLSSIKLTTFLFYSMITIIVVYLISSVFSWLRKKSKASYYSKLAQKKRTQRDQYLKQLKLPSINISASLKDEILNSDSVALIEMLKSQKVTSEQILVTYFERACTIGLDLELLAEINFEEALTKARECDRQRKSNPNANQGILFGLPMSIKDCFRLKGTDATGGMACRLFKPDEEDGLLVKLLKSEGAIPYVKSNIPQVMMSNETKNFIWGEGKNPWDKGRTVGGSSGGEGGLVASRCSPLGLGNDIGGSIRIPAICCGVVGFKPTAERVTTAGTMKVVPLLDNLLNLRVATGPITKSVRDVNLLMKVLLNGKAHDTARLEEKDPYYIRKEWQEDLVLNKQKGLKIGYYKSCDFFPASPANQRAVEEAAEALRKQGHDVFEVEFPNIQEIIFLFFEICACEGECKFLSDGVQGENIVDDYDKVRLAASIPNSLRKVLSVLIDLVGEKRVAMLVDIARKRDAHEYFQLIDKQTLAKRKFFKVWEERKLDALLSPSFAYPAQKLGYAKDINLGACYTFVFNVLNIPTGAIPVTIVKEGEDDYPRELSKHHDLVYKKTLESMQGSKELPVSVQISTLPWQEEKCVNIMLQLEEAVQFAKKYRCPI